MTKVTIDRELIEQAIAGAIFDFAGYLTSHPDTIEVGSVANAAVMVERIRAWAGYSGLSIENANVEKWNATLAEPAVEPACKQPLQVHKPTGWVAHKNQYAMPVLFNPYTGEPRDVRDVQSDPQGVLIVPPGKVEMIAAEGAKQMDQVIVSRELLRQVIEKAEATTRHFNIERLGESTYKDTNTRCELHEAVNKLRVALEQPAVEPVMIYHGRCTIDCGEHGHHDVEMLRMIPAGTKLYASLAEPAVEPLLSDEEMWHLWNAQGDDAMDQVSAIAFARAIEQAVRRKVGLK